MNHDLHVDLFGNPDQPGVTYHFEVDTYAEAYELVGKHPGFNSRVMSAEYRAALKRLTERDETKRSAC